MSTNTIYVKIFKDILMTYSEQEFEFSTMKLSHDYVCSHAMFSTHVRSNIVNLLMKLESRIHTINGL